ncbi:hypothetical protein Tsubulata_032755, partial [Turnera subulata]
KRGRQTLLPVFYDVDPSDVRHQRGTFADALGRLSYSFHKDKVDRWRKALTEASNISGFVFSTHHQREVSQQHKGMEQLQEQFLSYVFRTMEVKIHTVARGKKLIEQRHCGKKVLLVLDDVDEIDQFNSIVRSRDWFGTGSRIIITTRNEDLLEQLGVDKVCITPEMNVAEALELFSWHAFGKSYPKPDFLEWSKEIVRYCQGLPLALEVLGGVLFRQKEPQWRHQLKKLRKIPEDKIQEKLRISYDALSGFEDKNIFLDISCFLVGMDRDYVVRILNGCGFSGERALEFLSKRCLLSINESNKLMMHDLLRDMGREIVRQESPKEPEKRSRLWLREDVINTLRMKKGVKAIQGLKLTLPRGDDRIVETKNLRLLQFSHVKFKTGYEEDLFEELRWLYWHDFPLEFLPNEFHLGKVVIVDMQHSNLRQVWKNP